MLGAAVLIALAVLFLPMLFSSTPPKSDADQTVSLAIPPAPDRELQTRTLDVTPNGSPATVNGPQTAGAPAGAAPQQPAPAVSAPPASVTPGGGGRLASVDIASRKPADALPEDFANAPASPLNPTAAGAAPASAGSTMMSGALSGLGGLIFGTTGPRGGKHDGLVDLMAKSAARSAGSAIMRGVLGSLMGGKRRR